MNDSQRVRVILIMAVASLLLFAVLAFTLEPQDLQQVCIALVMATSGGVVAAYGPNVIEAIDRGSFHKGDVLMVGQVVACGGIFLTLSYQLVFNYLGRPVELRYHPFVATTLYLVAVGYALHLAAPGVIELQYPRRYWIRVGVVTMIGLLIAVGMFFLIE